MPLHRGPVLLRGGVPDQGAHQVVHPQQVPPDVELDEREAAQVAYRAADLDLVAEVDVRFVRLRGAGLGSAGGSAIGGS